MVRDLQSRLSTSSSLSTLSSSTNYSSLATIAAFTFINVVCYLLDKQIAQLSEQFENEAGFTERLYRVKKTKKGLTSLSPLQPLSPLSPLIVYKPRQHQERNHPRHLYLFVEELPRAELTVEVENPAGDH
ncbi:MAG: four helix bundle suffix domain-containing protein [Lentisphaerales bacterium]|nr:four helix bundle suffix domain-containing protein [Lentisphaerales bacterium]